MKIDITSRIEIDHVYLIDLAGNKIDLELGKETSLQDGWYELNVPYTGKENDIVDICVNNETLKETMYTGWYMDGKNNRHQPNMAVWDEGGVFKIWVHTNLGVYFNRVLSEIWQGDFGTNLDKNYTITVDRPMQLKKEWPASIKGFFEFGDGPHWWRLGQYNTPYKVLELDLPPVEKVIEECNKVCTYEITSHEKSLEVKSTSDRDNELPFNDLSDADIPYIKNLIQQIGFTNILDMSLTKMKPGSTLELHKATGNYSKKSYPYMRGCKKFYWALTEYKDWYFKLGRAGILPLDKPCLINTTEHVHTVVNERTDHEEDRYVFSLYGELPDDK